MLLMVGSTDPSGGGGLPADVKTAGAMGLHGSPVVSAVTVRDSGKVLSSRAVDPEILMEQLRAVVRDGPVSGVKSGVLGSCANVSVLAGFLKNELKGIPYVLYPRVTCAGPGSTVNGEVLRSTAEKLLPLSTLCTPDLAEAMALAGMDGIDGLKDMIEAGRTIMERGAGAVLVRGGRSAEGPADVLVTGDRHRVFNGRRTRHKPAHGTGGTLAGACAALLAAGFSMEESVRTAELYLDRTLSRKIVRIHGSLPGHLPEAVPMPGSPDGSAFYLPPAYCARCGNAMSGAPGGEGHLHCVRCGLVHYRNPLPAVALVVRNGDRILLVRRAVPPEKGRLCLPGGFLELGETPREGGRRELLEETGLTADETRVLELTTDTTAYGGILLVVLEVTGWTGTAEPGDDASEILWRRPGETGELAFRAHDRIVARLGGAAEGMSSSDC